MHAGTGVAAIAYDALPERSPYARVERRGAELLDTWVGLVAPCTCGRAFVAHCG